MQNPAHGNFSGKRLVVFGAGYLGSAVASQARDAGASVTAITRNAATAERLRAAGVASIVADIADRRWQGEVTGAPDFVLYCASGGGAGLDGYVHSYLQGMETVLSWLKEAGAAATLVYTSSTSVYPQDGGVAVDESAPTVPPGEDRTGILAATERAVARAGGAYIRAFVLRLAGIYGPQRHALLDEIRSGSVSGVSTSRLNLIHRDDAVSAIVWSFVAPGGHVGGIFNVTDGSPATRGEIAAWTCRELGIPLPEFTGATRGSRRPVSLNRVIVSTKLQRELDWTPTFPTFREGYAGLLRERALTPP